MIAPAHDVQDVESVLSHLRVYGPKRAAIKACAAAVYARVSKDTQESIPVQLEACRHYAARLGLPIAEEYQETKSGLITTRPEYRHMLALARSGKISHLILFKADRFGREDGEYITAFRQLEKLGVEVHGTDVGRVEPGMVGIHAFIANQEVRNISARVLPALIHRAKNGRAMQRPPIGYRITIQRGVFEPDHYAPAVSELFARYAGGESLYAVTEWFNARTGLAKRGFGIRRLLENPFYAGIIVFNRHRGSKIDGHYAKERHEWVHSTHDAPLVDRETWQAVQARLAMNSNLGQQRAAGPQYPLTGLIWCEACQKRVHGQPDETGKYPFYHCPYCGRSKSNRKVERALQRLLADVPIGTEVVAALYEYDAHAVDDQMAAQAGEITARIERLQERRTRLTILYAEGQIPATEYRSALSQTDTERDALRAEQDALSRNQTDDYATGATLAWLQTVTNWTGIFEGASIERRHEVYCQCIAGCYVDFAANTLRVRWLPAIARLTRRDEQVISLSTAVCKL